ncbi:hypothetical protein KJ359_012059 [Pestalotiopsis sp. 9143b]|nr:hypothetical protein KJ359_012059 [Pestalotiopsis sp. 9143b]
MASSNVKSRDANAYDVIIVGAGFGGCYQLKNFRDQGYKVRLLEAGTGYGGFSDPDLWKEWSWRQRFPDHTELRAYFNFVADKWDLRKDTQFNSFVQSATWNDADANWTIRTKEGDVFQSKYLSLNTGFAAKRYIPDWKDIDTSKGEFLHPSYWPHEGLGTDLHGKKIAVIGPGSTGVQLATELAAIAGHLTVFPRTINTCMPMGQVDFENGQRAFPRQAYPKFFESRPKSFGGFDFDFMGRGTFEDDAETRQKTYEQLWAEGDFKFWLATYYDMLFTKDANREAYNFWRDKTRARINDERLRNLLAPMEQPYSFGCKRISLEKGYFEIYNQENDSDNEHHEFDVIVCATGYDACTGGLRQIDIRGAGGRTLSDHWSGGAYTYLGMTASGFPNMYMTYAPQGPTALCNGPTCAELHGQWIINAVGHMRDKGLDKMEANAESEREWKENVINLANASLLPSTKSW